MMKAMILAAGRGERMRPLTDETPKALLQIGGKPLIEYHLERLARDSIKEVTINLGHLGAMIRAYLGDGARYGLNITYSDEGGQPLETGGGIVRTLKWLGGGVFVVINCDIFCDRPIRPVPLEKPEAHLVMVGNPPHNPGGDFHLAADRVSVAGGTPLTFAGIGYYKPSFFRNAPPGRFPLSRLLREKIAQGAVTGEHYTGLWMDIGTPARLAEADGYLAQRNHG